MKIFFLVLKLNPKMCQSLGRKTVGPKIAVLKGGCLILGATEKFLKPIMLVSQEISG